MAGAAEEGHDAVRTAETCPKPVLMRETSCCLLSAYWAHTDRAAFHLFA